MTNEQQKKIIARLRRLAGQVRALEADIGNSDAEKVTNQFLAVIAASQAALRLYVGWEVLSRDEIADPDRQLLAKLLGRID